MTEKEIMLKYGLPRSTAMYVVEYIREMDTVDESLMPLIVGSAVSLVNESERVLGERLTLEEIQNTYNELPTYIRNEFGDKYLRGYFHFLLG